MYDEWIILCFIIYQGYKFVGEGDPRKPQKLNQKEFIDSKVCFMLDG